MDSQESSKCPFLAKYDVSKCPYLAKCPQKDSILKEKCPYLHKAAEKCPEFSDSLKKSVNTGTL